MSLIKMSDKLSVPLPAGGGVGGTSAGGAVCEFKRIEGEQTVCVSLL